MRLILLAILFLFCTSSFAQTPPLQCKEPIKLSLSVSPPSPRQNSHVAISVDFASILDSLYGAMDHQDPSLSLRRYKLDDYPVFSLDSLKTGRYELGPYNFVLNRQPYTTEKLQFIVDDSLQKDEFGIWIRHTKTNDSTFCVTIEQKQILENKQNLNREEYIRQNFGKGGLGPIFIELKEEDYQILRHLRSTNRSTLEETETNKGKVLYEDSFYYICFEKKANTGEFVLTRDHFENLPADFKFEPIIIR